jgi:hypothetical protein
MAGGSSAATAAPAAAVGGQRPQCSHAPVGAARATRRVFLPPARQRRQRLPAAAGADGCVRPAGRRRMLGGAHDDAGVPLHQTSAAAKHGRVVGAEPPKRGRATTPPAGAPGSCEPGVAAADAGAALLLLRRMRRLHGVGQAGPGRPPPHPPRGAARAAAAAALCAQAAERAAYCARQRLRERPPHAAGCPVQPAPGRAAAARGRARGAAAAGGAPRPLPALAGLRCAAARDRARAVSCVKRPRHKRYQRVCRRQCTAPQGTAGPGQARSVDGMQAFVQGGRTQIPAS